MGYVSAFFLAPFDGNGEFSIWLQKVKGILVQKNILKLLLVFLMI